MINKWILSVLLVVTCHSVGAAELQLQVDNIRDGRGKLVVALFDQVTAFQQQHVEHASALMVQRVQKGTMRFNFQQLPAGLYAVMVHHDANGDGLFNMKGDIPLEGYGFLHGEGKQGIPEFKRASIELTAKDASRVSSSLIYFKH